MRNPKRNYSLKILLKSQERQKTIQKRFVNENMTEYLLFFELCFASLIWRNKIEKRKNRAATNFAGKEAVVKAFGTGFLNCMPGDIEILRDDFGKPYVNLLGRAKKLAEDRGIVKIHISLSDTDKIATAFVVAEGE